MIVHSIPLEEIQAMTLEQAEALLPRVQQEVKAREEAGLPTVHLKRDRKNLSTHICNLKGW